MKSNHIGVIPLNDTIFVTKQIENPELDEWGVPMYDEVTKEYKCHISYNHKQETIQVGKGKIIVYTAKIYIEYLAFLEKQDKISFYDMLGNLIEKEIETVYPVRDFGGNIIATCVIV